MPFCVLSRFKCLSVTLMTHNLNEYTGYLPRYKCFCDIWNRFHYFYQTRILPCNLNQGWKSRKISCTNSRKILNARISHDWDLRLARNSCMKHELIFSTISNPDLNHYILKLKLLQLDHPNQIFSKSMNCSYLQSIKCWIEEKNLYIEKVRKISSELRSKVVPLIVSNIA